MLSLWNGRIREMCELKYKKVAHKSIIFTDRIREMCELKLPALPIRDIRFYCRILLDA